MGRGRIQIAFYGRIKNQAGAGVIVATQKKSIMTTVVGHWMDAIASYGLIDEACSVTGSEQTDVIYYGSDPGVADLLLCQPLVQSVRQYPPTSARNDLVIRTISQQSKIPNNRAWMELLGVRTNHLRVFPTHITDQSFRRPCPKRARMRLPSRIEAKWKNIDRRSIVVHPFSSSDGHRLGDHWKTWRFAFKAIQKMAQTKGIPVILTGDIGNASQEVAGNTLDLVGKATMMDLFAIVNRCQAVFTTSDALAMWATLTRTPSVIVTSDLILHNQYMMTWMSGGESIVIPQGGNHENVLSTFVKSFRHILSKCIV